MSEFTPGQIQEILDIFFDNFAHRQYIGARYVPIFGRKGEESIEWDNTDTYEPLTIVLNEGNSFTSRQFVPVGVDIDNADYWAETGNYNAQIELYRQEVQGIANIIPDSEFSSENTVKDYIDLKSEDVGKVFETVSDMKQSSILESGMICKTLGFRNKGDNGAAWYEIKNTGTANEMDIIECGELFAHLITPNVITPEIFGAYGNGTNDDTAYLAFAVQYAYDTGIRSVTLDKQYLITDTIEIAYANMSIVGAGELSKNYSNHILFNPENSVGILFEINNTGFNMNGVKIKCSNKNTTLNAPSVSTGQTCLYYNPTNISGGNENVDTDIFNCSFGNFNVVIGYVGQNHTIKNCAFSGCQWVVYQHDSSLNSRNLWIENCRFHLIGADFPISQCIRLTQGNTSTAYVTFGVTIENNVFDFCKEIYMGSSNIVFKSNYIRNPVKSSNPILRIINVSNYKSESAKHDTEFSNNVYINDRTENIQEVFLRIEQTKHAVISNNLVQGTSSYAFALVNCESFSVLNNTLITGDDSNYALTCVNASNSVVNGNVCKSTKTYDGTSALDGTNYSTL